MLAWFGVGPNAEGEDFVDPILRVAFIVVLARDWFASGEAIGAEVGFGWNVHKLEVKKFDGGDPSVRCSVWLDIRVVQHAFDELGVHLYDQVSNANNMNSKRTKGPK